MKPECRIIQGDCRTELAKLSEKSVHMCVTSPPYHGLRKYEGVEPSVWGNDTYQTCDDHGERCSFWDDPQANPCVCGAWFGLLGLEPSIDQFVRNMVECFRAVNRVLRDDGTLWLNLGDSYGKSSASGPQGQTGQRADRRFTAEGCPATGMAKNLIGQPWRVAFALQADGWYLRSDIIWHKPNPMPESVTDRPTRAHEYLFLLTKKPKYYYDAEAVRESSVYPMDDRKARSTVDQKRMPTEMVAGVRPGSATYPCRNKRSVWTIPTEANPEAHFASFPRKLVLPCVLAGTSEKGCCPECGTPWVRIVERDRQPTRPGTNTKIKIPGGWAQSGSHTSTEWMRDRAEVGKRDLERHVTEVKTLGWRAGCECCTRIEVVSGHTVCSHQDGEPCSPPEPVPCTVLDPYLGSGTSLIVARQQGRAGIGVDASEEYCEMARRRIANPEPEPEPVDAPGQFTMFEEVAP